MLDGTKDPGDPKLEEDKRGQESGAMDSQCSIAEKKENRPVFGQKIYCPLLTENQVREVVAVIQSDYWQLRCWKCRTEGNYTFTCPYITIAQRVQFAASYFEYYKEANPLAGKDILENRSRRLI